MYLEQVSSISELGSYMVLHESLLKTGLYMLCCMNSNNDGVHLFKRNVKSCLAQLGS